MLVESAPRGSRCSDIVAATCLLKEGIDTGRLRMR